MTKSVEQRIEDLENRPLAKYDPSRPAVIHRYEDDPPLDLEPGNCPIVLLLTGTREEARLNKIKREAEFAKRKAAFEQAQNEVHKGKI